MAFRHIARTVSSTIVALSLLGVASPSLARSVFLNGTDISSAKSQELKDVNVAINENGDIFIIAPHYQVQEEDSYVPLSKYVQGLNSPAHKSPGMKPTAGLPSHPQAQAPGVTQVDSDGQLQKAGEKEKVIGTPNDGSESAQDIGE